MCRGGRTRCEAPALRGEGPGRDAGATRATRSRPAPGAAWPARGQPPRACRRALAPTPRGRRPSGPSDRPARRGGSRDSPARRPRRARWRPGSGRRTRGGSRRGARSGGRGRGRYVEDLRFPGMLHAAFVRSPHAHARVRSIDTAAARALGGVVAIYPSRDLPECARPIPPSIAAPAGFRPTAQPVFADPLVRYVGEVVAAVVAEDPYVATDAAAAVVVDYEPLPAAGTMERALEPGAPRVFDGWPDNVAGLSTARVGDAAAGLAGADVVVEARLGIARVHGVPIETRGIVATPARRLARPVKWAESRREHFLTASPDRGQRHVARMGLSREGIIAAVATQFTREHGAYVASGEVVTRNTINHLPGPYRIPSLDVTASNVVTNPVFGAAYRGSGRPT